MIVIILFLLIKGYFVAFKFLKELDLSGLAEAGLISSNLSRRDMRSSSEIDESSLCFCPER